MILWVQMDKGLSFSIFVGLSAAVGASVYRPLSPKPSQSALFMSVCSSSVLLQSFSQEIVEAGNHRSGIIVQACCDHGVVIDLQNRDQEKSM